MDQAIVTILSYTLCSNSHFYWLYTSKFQGVLHECSRYIDGSYRYLFGVIHQMLTLIQTTYHDEVVSNVDSIHKRLYKLNRVTSIIAYVLENTCVPIEHLRSRALFFYKENCGNQSILQKNLTDQIGTISA